MLETFLISDLYDVAACDGVCAMAAIILNRAYCGFTFSPEHASALRARLVEEVLKGFATEGHELFHAHYAKALKGAVPDAEEDNVVEGTDPPAAKKRARKKAAAPRRKKAAKRAYGGDAADEDDEEDEISSSNDSEKGSGKST